MREPDKPNPSVENAVMAVPRKMNGIRPSYLYVLWCSVREYGPAKFCRTRKASPEEHASELRHGGHTML